MTTTTSTRRQAPGRRRAPAATSPRTWADDTAAEAFAVGATRNVERLPIVAITVAGMGEVPFGCYAPYALDPEHAERLWALSEKLIVPA